MAAGPRMDGNSDTAMLVDPDCQGLGRGADMV